MKAWLRDTEISSTTLTSLSYPRPILILFLLELELLIKSSVLIMWNIFLSSLLRLSRMIKFFCGLSTPTMSTIWFLYAILKGKIYLQISQSTLLNFSITWPLCTFLWRLVSSHDLRHFKWIVPYVPVHLQGEMSGFGSSSSASGLFSRSSASVPQHILQTASSDCSVKFVGLTRPA